LFGNLDDAISGKNQPHRLFQLKNKSLNFLVYNTVFPPFDNKTNRQRIHSSINRVALCENILDGDGEPTKNFFVPINYFKSLNNAVQEISAVEEGRGNTLKAGDKFNFFVNKNTSELGLKWVNELILQIQVKTGVSINLIKGSNEDFERMWKKGEIHIAKYGWAADYPDPDSYLGVFYSRSTLAKQISFSSAQYDSVYLNSFRKSNRLDRLTAQLACDRFLIQNAFFSPLFLQDFIFVVNINMRDFKVNMEGLLDFSCVFYKPVQKLN
ncbi:MAG: ABC transporter substrate-binding protein, partial [Crocinitomicaceae bacterium]